MLCKACCKHIIIIISKDDYVFTYNYYLYRETDVCVCAEIKTEKVFFVPPSYDGFSCTKNDGVSSSSLLLKPLLIEFISQTKDTLI